jgi:pimeloyl-ACP methyl ester carboxylesterase
MDGERRKWTPRGHGIRHVCFYVAQRQRGRPLVLVHDLRVTSSAYEMRPLFECFRWRRPTVAIDLPGFGLSDRSPLPYGPALFAEVLSELLGKLHHADVAPDVVALGRGSEVAARVARDEPGLVRSLVMLEPSWLVPARGRTFESLGARVVRLLGERATRALFALSTTRPLVRRAVSVRFHGAPHSGLVAYAQASARSPGAHRAPLAALMRGPRCVGAQTLYGAVTQPVLVVHDMRGNRAAELEAFLRARGNRFAVRVGPTRGMPQFEQFSDTVAALDRFWQSLPRAACDRATR